MSEKNNRDSDGDAGGSLDFNDPDAENSEQNEAGTQAQDIANDALHGSDLAEDSEHGNPKDPTQIIPDDVPDLIDRMKDMERSGRIDMDAFEGEENMDDEDGE